MFSFYSIIKLGGFMKIEIKNIIDSLGIKGVKDQLDKDKKQLFQNEREMASLTHDREVGLFAFKLDEYLYLLEK